MKKDRHSGIWGDSLVSTILNWTEDYLKPKESVTDGLDWRVSRDNQALEARKSDTDVEVGSLNLRVLWPRYIGDNSGAGNLKMEVDCRSGSVSEDWRYFEEQARIISRRLTAFEKKLPQIYGKLFPRDTDGLIDWRLSPLSKTMSDMDTRSGGMMFKMVDIPCGLRCSFCSVSLKKYASEPPELFWMDQLYKAAISFGWVTQPGTEMIIGGTQAISHPDIASLLRLAKTRGYEKIRLDVSLPDRIDDEFARLLASEGLTEVRIPLYGTSAATHDEIVERPGNFDRTLAAIPRLLEQNIDVSMHTVALKQNLHELAEIPGLCESLGARFCEVMFPVDAGTARLSHAEQIPLVAKLPLSVLALVNLNIPCLKLGCENFRQDVQRDFDTKRSFLKEHGRGGEFGQVCRGCKRLDQCSGFYKGYLETHGEGELRAF